ncbi:hypothetical protein R3W88_005127 [Solanum pinnatisectum]|uniref:RRM domain-containing protein n=1 Tax=Solanum pinnatisectum TaxID=50273 RepID=A0AAV9KDF1_9SOLN|nr:hypothetical protein R3W88_005127 [Solanum pinnatisectum]
MLMYKGEWPSSSSVVLLQPPNGPKSFKTQASLSSYPLASKVMVRNLSYSTDESCLEKIFSNFGHVTEGLSLWNLQSLQRKTLADTQKVVDHLWKDYHLKMKFQT